MIRKQIFAALFTSAALFAQGPPPGGRGPGGPGGFGPPGLGIGPGSAVVTGAPFSAVEQFQSTQTLADGNTIQHSNQGNVYRDSQGRMRTETTMTPPAGSSGQSRTMVMIFDPVSGYEIRLDPQTSTAVKTLLPTGTPPAPPANPNAPVVTTTDLGAKTINGLSATGKETTITIAAGAIGNAKALTTVRDVWTSVDLQIPLLVTTTDSQSGSSTMTVTSITRAEPDASLFQVPSNYTVSTRARPGRGPNE